MSDLISRKVVMDWLRELQTQSIINEHNGTIVDATIHTTVNHFINFIVQLPTTYDVDNVVEQLETLKSKISDKEHNYWNNAISNSISIVKGAVKNETNTI